MGGWGANSYHCSATPLGLEITDLDALTGLLEYRNGGLCLNLGLLQVKDQQILQQSHPPGAAAIVEWRALTVCLLDAIAPLIRQRLNLSAFDLPLVEILQGGTWAAGRKIAAARRPGGTSPTRVESDGTVFIVGRVFLGFHTEMI